MSKVTVDSTVLTGMVSYMKGADSILSKQAAIDNAIAVEAAGIVNALVGANLIPASTKSASVARLKEDPTYMVELLRKAASAMVTSPTGTSAESVKSASVELSANDVFVRELLA